MGFRLARSLPRRRALAILSAGFLSLAFVAAWRAHATDQDRGIWLALSGAGAPTNRSFSTLVWTGNELLLWGGQMKDGSYRSRSDGYRYNPRTQTWRPMTIQGAPSPRYLFSTVWTGREMIVWGGQPDQAHDLESTGGRYDPVADVWRPVAVNGAPSGRVGHTAVWTGREMMVWGGSDTASNELNTGGRYDPVADRWMTLPLTGAPAARYDHCAVWSGQEMLVWGGHVLRMDDWLSFRWEYPPGLGRYNPSQDQWFTQTITNAPSPRAYASAVWSGREMIVWGGAVGDRLPGYQNTGGCFDPASGTWRATSLTNAPTPREQPVAVWTGGEMIIWGGFPTNATGGRYQPTTDCWIVGNTVGAPAGLQSDEAAWTGEELLGFTDRLYSYYQPGLYARDGLPDSWQERFFGRNNADALPSSDPDGDGQNNLLEYVAGTDPTNPGSRLNFSAEPVGVAAEQVRLTFTPRAEGRSYTVFQGATVGGPCTPLTGAAASDWEGGRSLVVSNRHEWVQWFRLQITLP